ncbi:MAG: S1C family serine protease [Pirellulales bacterium]
MKKSLLLCGLSATVGAVLAIWAGQRLPVSRLAAQEAAVVPLPGRTPTESPLRTPAVLPATGDQLTPEERINVAVYQRVHQSVVNINTRSVHYSGFFPVEVPSEGLGSGSVIDQQGHILTNFHVIEDAQQIMVTLVQGKPYPARRVGDDPLNDIAVLKIDAPAEELHPIRMGTSVGLKVGQRVYVIGSPFELERTFTTGIISSLNRTLPSRNPRRIIKSIIQVDAAMNPGNSGGPLLNTRAQMIGMNTAIASKTGENTGVGFAVPVERIKRVVPELIRFGHVNRPETGINSVFLTDQGLLIRTLTPGGPAEKAGLRGVQVTTRRERQGLMIVERRRVDPSTADLITQVDGQKIDTLDDFLSLVEAKKPGETVVLTIIRDDRLMKVPLRLAADQP